MVFHLPGCREARMQDFTFLGQCCGLMKSDEQRLLQNPSSLRVNGKTPKPDNVQRLFPPALYLQGVCSV